MRHVRLAAAIVAGLTLFATAACGGDETADGGTVQLRFSWWGNNDRAETTRKVLAAFEAKNPGIKVTGDFADFNAYFDKLATEVASGRGADVITLGGAYPREYGGRGALLDLSRVGAQLKTDKIDPAALGNGRFDNKQFGVPTGVNTPAIVADPVVFDKAGVALPDDATWTWDDFVRIATDVAKKSPKGTFGVADPTKSDTLDVFARQRGEALYSADGKLAISEQTLTDWWTMTTRLRDAGASPPAALTAELAGQPSPEQTLIGRGLAGLQVDWSNQLGALRKASGHPLKLLRYPGESTARQKGMWVQASQVYTINARSKHPEEAAKLVDFLVNSEEAGKLILTDRGIPANADVLEAILPSLDENQKAQAEFIDAALPTMGPPLVIGPEGSTDTPNILTRLNDEVLFNRRTPQAAAAEFTKQVETAIR